jgi:hypothetical protein
MRFVFSKSTPLLSFSKKIEKIAKGLGVSGEGKNIPFFDKNKFFFGGGGVVN